MNILHLNSNLSENDAGTLLEDQKEISDCAELFEYEISSQS